MKVTIELSEERATTLRETARRIGVTLEELAGAALSDALDHSKEDFLEAAEYVLKKNEQLFRRLAQGPR